MEKYFNVVISGFDGDLPTATIMEVKSENSAAKNCRKNPEVHDDYYIVASSYEDAHGNLWGEKVGRRVTMAA